MPIRLIENDKAYIKADAVIKITTPPFHMRQNFIINVYDKDHRIIMSDPISLSSYLSEEQLKKAYYTCLKAVEDYSASSVAFPLFSSVISGYPKEKDYQCTMSVFKDYLSIHDIEIFLIIHDTYELISSKLYTDLNAYINSRKYEIVCEGSKPWFYEEETLDDYIGHKELSFGDKLFELIDQRGMNDPDVYRTANITRQTFSKLRSKRNYVPRKKTAIALVIALKLNIEEAEDLLERAGMILSKSITFDLIIRYFIEKKNYDIYAINIALFEHNQETLGD